MRSDHVRRRVLLTLLAGLSLAGCAGLGVPIEPVPPFQPFNLQSAAPDASPLPEGTQGAATMFFSSSDGYALMLPDGWEGASLGGDDTDLALALLRAADPALGELARTAIETVGARISMVGGDVASSAASSTVPSGMAVLIMPANRISDDETEELVAGLLAATPRVNDELQHKVVTLPAGDAHRFELLVVGDSLGDVRLRLYLFSVGADAVLVAVGSDPASFSDSAEAFDTIIKSLRFGV